MKLFLRFIILLVGFSFPLNSISLQFVDGRDFSIGFMVSILYVVCMLPYLTKLTNLTKTYGKVVFLPLFFLLLLTITNYIYSSEAPDIPIFNTSIFLCFVLMCFMLYHSIFDKDAIQFCLWGFSLGCCLVAIIFWEINGVGPIDERITFLEENANGLGIYMAIGSIIILNDFMILDKLKLGLLRFIFIIPVILLVSALFATASRTAFLILSLSLIVLVVLYPTKNRYAKGIVIIIGLVGIVALGGYLITNSDDYLVVSRLLEVEDDNMSGRGDIWLTLIPHISEHPILGVGQTGYASIGKYILNHTKEIGGITYGFSPHNVIIEVALYTGILGLSIWLIFWGTLIQKSLKSYKYAKEYLSILLLIPIVASILSGQILAAKWAYMIYAYIFAQFAQLQQPQNQSVE